MMMLLVAVVLIGVLTAVARNERKRRAIDSSTVDLRHDEQGVTRSLGDGRTEHVRWDRLQEVEVLVTATGPVLVLTGEGQEGCLAPIALAAERGIVDHLHQLPRFDGLAFRQGLEAPPQTRTTCWTRITDP